MGGKKKSRGRNLTLPIVSPMANVYQLRTGLLDSLDWPAGMPPSVKANFAHVLAQVLHPMRMALMFQVQPLGDKKADDEASGSRDVAGEDDVQADAGEDDAGEDVEESGRRDASVLGRELRVSGSAASEVDVDLQSAVFSLSEDDVYDRLRRMEEPPAQAVQSAVVRVEKAALAAVASIQRVALASLAAQRGTSAGVGVSVGVEASAGVGPSQSRGRQLVNIADRVSEAKRVAAAVRIRSTSPIHNIEVHSADGRDKIMATWPDVEAGLASGQIHHVQGLGYFLRNPGIGPSFVLHKVEASGRASTSDSQG